MPFIGRAFEMEQLNAFFDRKIAGFAVCCGRRRIGKSRLIEEVGKRSSFKFIELYGLAPRKGVTNKTQLENFAEQLANQFKISTPKFTNWQQALDLLAALTKAGAYILFLDEISWMVGKDKDFPGKLKGVWDTTFKHNPQLRLIVCGSVSSWIQANILRNKGFVGRVSLTIELDELPLKDANQFWADTPYVSSYEKFKILSVTGGIPRYLEEIDPHLSAEQNIKRLCFSKGGILLNEFEKIFSDLFGKKSQKFQEIARTLVNQPLSAEEISTTLGMNQTGYFYEKISMLTECGFLTRDHTWNGTHKSKKLSKFRLKDNYLRFYLKYIEEKKPLIDAGLLRNIDLENLNDWLSIMGLQFENLVLNNLPILLKILDIPEESLLSAAPYFQRKTKRHSGVQIDLLIQTRFTYYVCEIKFRKHIQPLVIDEVQQKITALKLPQNISARPVLIYQGSLSKNIPSKNFFSHIISFDDFL